MQRFNRQSRFFFLKRIEMNKFAQAVSNWLFRVHDERRKQQSLTAILRRSVGHAAFRNTQFMAGGLFLLHGWGYRGHVDEFTLASKSTVLAGWDSCTGRTD